MTTNQLNSLKRDILSLIDGCGRVLTKQYIIIPANIDILKQVVEYIEDNSRKAGGIYISNKLRHQCNGEKPLVGKYIVLEHSVYDSHSHHLSVRDSDRRETICFYKDYDEGESIKEDYSCDEDYYKSKLLKL